MDIPIEFRKVIYGDEEQVFDFIKTVFNQFVAPEFTEEGIEEFMKYIQPGALVRHLRKNHFALMASTGSAIIGVIVVRDFDHIALFFVDGQYQRKGIGRELLDSAVKVCERHDPSNTRLTVNASPNSIDAYRRLNFEPNDTEQCVNGIRFIPMTLRLQKP